MWEKERERETRRRWRNIEKYIFWQTTNTILMNTFLFCSCVCPQQIHLFYNKIGAKTIRWPSIYTNLFVNLLSVPWRISYSFILNLTFSYVFYSLVNENRSDKFIGSSEFVRTTFIVISHSLSRDSHSHQRKKTNYYYGIAALQLVE